MLDVRYDTPKETLRSVTAQPFARYAKLASRALVPTVKQIPDSNEFSSRGSVFKRQSEPLGARSASISSYQKMRRINELSEGYDQQLSVDVSNTLMHDEMHSNEYLFFLSNAVQDSFLEPLRRRVEELALLALSEEGQSALSQASLVGFWRFFYLHRSKLHWRPQLVLTMEGELRAIWEKDKNHRIAVRFIDGISVSYVTFFPDQFRPTQICRKGGNSSIEGFFENTGISRIAN